MPIASLLSWPPLSGEGEQAITGNIMLGDPQKCREYGLHCRTLAEEVTHKRLKRQLMDLSRIWTELAKALDETMTLMAIEAMKPKPGRSSN